MSHYSVWKHDYNDDWIIKNYTGKCTKDFTERYVAETGHNVKQSVLRKHISKQLGIKSYGYYYTEEELEFVRLHYSRDGAKYCAKQLGCSVDRIYGMANTRLGIKMSKEDFCKHVNVYESQYPVGTIKASKDDGSDWVIKTDEGWKSLGRYAYEKYIGPIPEGYYVVFLNRDVTDARPENLMAVPKGVVGAMNANEMWSDNPQLTKVTLLYLILKRIYEGENNELTSEDA